MKLKENIEEEKKVKVFFQNPEASMKLKIAGKNALDHAIKIMKAFDKGCAMNRKKNEKEK